MKKLLVSLLGQKFSIRGVATIAIFNLIGLGLLSLSVQQLCEAYMLDDRGVHRPGTRLELASDDTLTPRAHVDDI